jgi:hypothetical protein
MAYVMNSLFGVTPEALMAQREAALSQQATNFAQLSPMQSAQAGFYTAGNRLAGAAGGLLGAQDPEMAKAAQRQSLLRQVQPSDAEGWKSLATQLWQSGDTQGAQEALAKAQTMTSEATKNALATSQIAENVSNAANRNYNMSPEGRAQELLKSGKYEPSSVANFVAGKGDLTPVDKFTKPSADFIAKAVEFGFGDKPTYGGYTPEQTAKVNQALYEQDISKKKAGKTDLVLPGQPVEPKDWLKFREFADKTPVMQKTSALLSELPNALETIRMSTSNDIAAAALPKALASVAGEGKVTSNADIQRYARTGGLDERLIQGATNFITGRATQTKKSEAEKYASAIYRGALLERKKFIQSEAKQLGYDQSPNYSQSIADIDAELAKFKKPSDSKRVDSVVRVQPTGNPLIDKYLNVQTP